MSQHQNSPSGGAQEPVIGSSRSVRADAVVTE